MLRFSVFSRKTIGQFLYNNINTDLAIIELVYMYMCCI